MEGHCSTGQSPQWVVVPMEEDYPDTRLLCEQGCENPCFFFFFEARGSPRVENFGQHCRTVLNVFLCPLGQYHKKNDIFFYTPFRI